LLAAKTAWLGLRQKLSIADDVVSLDRPVYLPRRSLETRRLATRLRVRYSGLFQILGDTAFRFTKPDQFEGI